jgi:hypothetical protein
MACCAACCRCCCFSLLATVSSPPRLVAPGPLSQARALLGSGRLGGKRKGDEVLCAAFHDDLLLLPPGPSLPPPLSPPPVFFRPSPLRLRFRLLLPHAASPPVHAPNQPSCASCCRSPSCRWPFSVSVYFCPCRRHPPPGSRRCCGRRHCRSVYPLPRAPSSGSHHSPSHLPPRVVVPSAVPSCRTSILVPIPVVHSAAVGIGPPAALAPHIRCPDPCRLPRVSPHFALLTPPSPPLSSLSLWLVLPVSSSSPASPCVSGPPRPSPESAPSARFSLMLHVYFPMPCLFRYSRASTHPTPLPSRRVPPSRSLRLPFCGSLLGRAMSPLAGPRAAMYLLLLGCGGHAAQTCTSPRWPPVNFAVFPPCRRCRVGSCLLGLHRCCRCQ